MQFFQNPLNFNWASLHMPTPRWTDVVEILIITFLIYEILVWAKATRLWSMLKGIVVIVIFIVIAVFFNMTTILWIVRNVLYVAVIAVVVIMQPELRKALEGLGRRRFIASVLPFDLHANEERFSDRTIDEIARACVEMAAVRTGALIVIEQEISLADVERTGIEVDGVVTSELLINIFEHNTPLHDGAVVIRGNRVAAATCYLPLSERTDIAKELGTRHRAGCGISEATDALTLIVSEETGGISVAYGGNIERGLNGERLKEFMHRIQNKPEQEQRQKTRGIFGKTGKGRKSGTTGASLTDRRGGNA
ncbi:MAG: diadenylate cyclase CdaA [Lachnospiraceae bacterium]|nr:diadenylate cyclase CdaA [Lachnospiraceae bacterium]